MVRQDPGQGSVPPIEDEVEKNYHGGVLTDSNYFAGLMVGLMSMSAATPPTLPAKDEAHDPARVLSDEQEQQRRRISLVSPSGAAHYVAMHEVVAQHASRSTPVNDLFHQARELISAVAQQVMPVACPGRESTGLGTGGKARERGRRLAPEGDCDDAGSRGAHRRCLAIAYAPQVRAPRQGAWSPAISPKTWWMRRSRP